MIHGPSRRATATGLQSWALGLVALAACAASPEVRHDSVERRLKRLETKLVAISKAPPVVTDEDLRFLERRGTDAEAYPPADLAMLVAFERFDETLTEEDLPEVEAYGVSREGRALGFPIVRLLAQRRRFDGAAAVMVATLSGRSNLSSRSFAKWWEYSFGGRPDYEDFTSEFASALRRLGESGTAEERRIVGALLARPEGPETEPAELKPSSSSS